MVTQCHWELFKFLWHSNLVVIIYPVKSYCVLMCRHHIHTNDQQRKGQFCSHQWWTYKLPTSTGLSEKQEFQKNLYFCFIDYAKAFDCLDHHKLWKILKEMGISDHLTCLLRNLYAGQEATVWTGHQTDWFQIGKGVHQGCILSFCLFNICRVHHKKHWAGRSTSWNQDFQEK